MRIKLTELSPQWLKIVDEKTVRTDVGFDEAQGVSFLCPKCFLENGGAVGTHYVWCWFRNKGVPDEYTPKPGRWTPEGTWFDDLTFVPGEPPMACSVKITSGCMWHGRVVLGDVTLNA
jgi:hypothetical protein